MNPLMRSVLTFLATNESRHDRTVLAFFISDQFVHFRKWGQIKDGGRLDNLKIYQVAEGIESTDALASSNDATRFVESSRDKRVMFLGMTLFHYMHVWDQLQQGLRALASFLLSSQGVKSNIWERVLLKPCPWTLWQLPEFIWNKGTRESAPFCCSEANRGLLHNASNLQTMRCDGQFLAKRSAFMVHHVTNRGIWCEWRSKNSGIVNLGRIEMTGFHRSWFAWEAWRLLHRDRCQTGLPRLFRDRCGTSAYFLFFIFLF